MAVATGGESRRTTGPISHDRLARSLTHASRTVADGARVVVVTSDPEAVGIARRAGIHADVRVPKPGSGPELVMSVTANLANRGHQVHLLSADPVATKHRNVHVRVPVSTWPGRRALLIDIENVGAHPRKAVPFLRAVLHAAGHVDVAVAAAAPPLADAYRDACAALGVTLLRAEPVRDGADIALVQHAQKLHLRGYGSFVVASGDHHLRRVPGNVEVLLPHRVTCSRRLAARATRVQRF